MVSDTTARRVLAVLIVLALLLVALVARPFAQALFLAAVLAGALHPMHLRLSRALRGRASVSATVLCAAIVFAVLGPLVGLAAYVVHEALGAVEFVTNALAHGGTAALLARLPGAVRAPLEWALARVTAGGVELGDVLRTQLGARGGAAAQAVTTVVARTGSMVFQLAMMLIALFFLLVDGRRVVAWTETVVPLKRGQTVEILQEFRSVSVAVLVSSIITAGVQAAAALVGYLIARVPAAVFFSVVTFFFALVPAVGAASVCLAAAALLLATGRPWSALFLAVWGVLVVGLVDNVVKPLLARRGMQMHGALVFFALLGGLATFGAIGLLVGPLAVSFFLALVRIWERDYGRPAPEPDAPATPPTAGDSAGS